MKILVVDDRRSSSKDKIGKQGLRCDQADASRRAASADIDLIVSTPVPRMDVGGLPEDPGVFGCVPIILRRKLGTWTSSWALASTARTIISQTFQYSQARRPIRALLRQAPAEKDRRGKTAPRLRHSLDHDAHQRPNDSRTNRADDKGIRRDRASDAQSNPRLFGATRCSKRLGLIPAAISDSGCPHPPPAREAGARFGCAGGHLRGVGYYFSTDRRFADPEQLQPRNALVYVLITSVVLGKLFLF